MASVHDTYMTWRTVEHASGCKARGWIAREQFDEHYFGPHSNPTAYTEGRLQLVCPLPAGCGRVVEVSASTDPRHRESGRPWAHFTVDHHKTVRESGFGSVPIRVSLGDAGPVWLHPTGPLVDRTWGGGQEDPEAYAITSSPTPPTRWREVLAVIGQC
ncbi:hypothetical protein, partial [Acrocarpospora phusangensis]|uniref:hypothetical protein n=1 Tax=Acrocarpospora phusangensis TaxID=1070424 RepID=UPI001950BA64